MKSHYKKKYTSLSCDEPNEKTSFASEEEGVSHEDILKFDALRARASAMSDEDIDTALGEYDQKRDKRIGERQAEYDKRILMWGALATFGTVFFISQRFFTEICSDKGSKCFPDDGAVDMLGCVRSVGCQFSVSALPFIPLVNNVIGRVLVGETMRASDPDDIQALRNEKFNRAEREAAKTGVVNQKLGPQSKKEL